MRQLGINWAEIDDVLLDMDGTLLDRHFDNFFFEEELPRRYAALQGLPFEESRDRLMAMYRSVEGELAWTDLHYWTERVGIDVVAKDKGIDYVVLNTNGIRIARDDKFLAGLQKLKPHIYLQFDGFDVSTNLALRGRADLLDFKLRALDRLALGPVRAAARRPGSGNSRYRFARRTRR